MAEVVQINSKEADRYAVIQQVLFVFEFGLEKVNFAGPTLK